MKLLSIQIEGFKCFKNSGLIPIHNFTMFVGENDSGKSTLLTAIDFLINNRPRYFNDKDFHQNSSANTPTNLISISGIFELNEKSNSELKKYTIDNKLYLKKKQKIGESGSQCYAKITTYENDSFHQIMSLEEKKIASIFKASDLKRILNDLGLSDESNQTKRIEKIKDSLKSTPQTMVDKEIEINWKEIADYLPIYQQYNSSNYGNPYSLIDKALQNVYRTCFYNEDESGQVILKENLKTLHSEIETNIDTEINTLKSIIIRHNPNIKNIRGLYNIDLSQGLKFNQLQIDTGGGLHPISNRGEGAKKRLFLSILEWSNQVENSIMNTRGIIKAYDEPDSNLHFEAQRKLFYTIKNENAKNTQSIVCTHSLALIDRAAASSINQLILNQKEQSSVSYLKTGEEKEVKDFIGQVFELGGLKNSTIFYERCFVLVEGESEENALPILYKKYFGRTMSEDGVVLINLYSNGSWQNFLKLLNKNKEGATLLFLDSDTQYTTSSATVTKEKLEEIGFSASFLTNSVVFTGVKEFEDTFPIDILLRTLNSIFPKKDETAWIGTDILPLLSASKYSKELCKKISIEHSKGRIGKPKLSLEFAKNITNTELVQLHDVIKLFQKIETILT